MPKLSTSIQTIDLSLAPHKIKDQVRYDPATGGTRWTLRGAARVCGVSHFAIRDILKKTTSPGGELSTDKYAKTLDTLRLQGGELSWLQDGIPDESVYTILEYYASQPSRTLARANLGFFAKLGIRASALMILGRVEAVEPSPEVSTQLVLEDAVTSLDVVSQPLPPNQTNDLLVRLLGAGKSAGLLGDVDFAALVSNLRQ